MNLPLCVVFDSASATSVLDFLDWLFSSGDELVSILSCLMSGLMSSPSSKLEDVSGDDDARRLGVEEAAPSTHRSPGAGSRGDAGGGVCTLVLLPDAFLPKNLRFETVFKPYLIAARYYYYYLL